MCRQVRRSRHQLYKHIDGDYYGFRDEEDGTLVKAEEDAELQLRKKVSILQLCIDICCSLLLMTSVLSRCPCGLYI